MTVVTFDPFAFKTRYPEFNAIANSRLVTLFPEACIYLSNKDNSPVQDIPRRTLLLNMLVAHIAYLNGFTSPNGQTKPVGRLSQASEGSVSVGLEYGTPGTQEWYVQSQYGAAFWQGTSSLRGFRYRPRPTRVW